MKKSLVLTSIKGTVTGLLLFCVAVNVSANSLFNFGHTLPDIQSQGLSVNYTGATGDFIIASNSPFEFNNYVPVTGGAGTFFFGSFLLDFSIDSAGAVDDSGVFSIIDGSNFLGFGSGANVLGGTIADFGFSNTTFEVVLDITSGALSSEFGLQAGSIVSGDFSGFLLASNFSATNVFGADTFTPNGVPEPSILVLFAVAGLSLFRTRKQYT